MKNAVRFLAVLLFFLSLLGWAVHARAQKAGNDAKVWEYKVGFATVGGSPSGEDRLNQLGGEGWELVAVENVGSTAPPSAVYCLKRVKQ